MALYLVGLIITTIRKLCWAHTYNQGQGNGEGQMMVRWSKFKMFFYKSLTLVDLKLVLTLYLSAGVDVGHLDNAPLGPIPLTPWHRLLIKDKSLLRSSQGLLCHLVWPGSAEHTGHLDLHFPSFIIPGHHLGLQFPWHPEQVIARLAICGDDNITNLTLEKILSPPKT